MMMKNPGTKISQITLFAEPAVMGVWIVLFYAYCARVMASLGHWASDPFERVPGGLDKGYHDQIVSRLLLLILVALIPWILWVVYKVHWSKALKWDWKVRTALLLCLVSIATLVVDPGGLLTWFLD